MGIIKTDTNSLRETFQRFNREPRTNIKKHHTFKRLSNFLLVRLQLLARTSFIYGYPYYLVLEPTNICNLKCPLCPTGQGVLGRPKGKLSFVNFKKIINEIGPYLYLLRMENWGEPLLNEEIFDMISYAKSKKIATSFNTNLSFLDEQSAKKLVLSELDHIKISLDGVTQESYAKYRVGGNFNKAVDNIRLLLRMRAELNKINPFIEIQFIVMKHNEGEIGQIKQLCNELGVDGLFLERVRPNMREELFNSNSYSIEKFKDWLPRDSEYSIFDYETKTRKSNLKICSWLWTSTVINWDGSIVPCCGIYDVHYDFGNIFNGGFRHTWNGPKYQAARRLIGRRKKTSVDVVCKFCYRRGVVLI